MLDEVMWRGAIPEVSSAEAAVQAALEMLADHLSAEDARAIAGHLPPSLAKALQRRGSSPMASPDALYGRLAESEQITLGLAVERARAACTSIAGALDEEERLRLARRLPPEWAELFVDVTRAPASELPPGTVPGHGHTLATGKPGSRHSLAEASPRGAQAESVVSTENPHADTKLSSVRESPVAGSLATGQPGANQPIAGAKDERGDR